MKREIEELIPDFPNDMAFWAFLILSSHNRRDIPNESLKESLLK